MIVVFIKVSIQMVYPYIIDLDALYGPSVLYMLPASVHPTFSRTIKLDPSVRGSGWNLNQAAQKS